MKRQQLSPYLILVCVIGIGLFINVAASSPPGPGSTPVGTAFTYQGELKKEGFPVTAAVPGCDFKFRLYDAELGGTQVGLERYRQQGRCDPGFWHRDKKWVVECPDYQQ